MEELLRASLEPIRTKDESGQVRPLTLGIGIIKAVQHDRGRNQAGRQVGLER